MSKDAKETLWAVSILAAVFACGYFLGQSGEYDKGVSDGMTLLEGDRWDCAYHNSTGFVICDRTPKYK